MIPASAPSGGWYLVVVAGDVRARYPTSGGSLAKGLALRAARAISRSEVYLLERGEALVGARVPPDAVRLPPPTLE